MKKSLITLGALGVFGTVAGAAHAQSSVTLYGLIDAGLTYTNNQGGAHNVQATSGAVNGSRWGLRGAEDLGGGLKAIFTLENGFNIMNGKPARTAASSAGRRSSACRARNTARRRSAASTIPSSITSARSRSPARSTAARRPPTRSTMTTSTTPSASATRSSTRA